jgi:hypothetical protein
MHKRVILLQLLLLCQIAPAAARWSGCTAQNRSSCRKKRQGLLPGQLPPAVAHEQGNCQSESAAAGNLGSCCIMVAAVTYLCLQGALSSRLLSCRDGLGILRVHTNWLQRDSWVAQCKSGCIAR